MIDASKMLDFLDENNIIIDSDVREEIRFNDAISYNNLVEVVEELMLAIKDSKRESDELEQLEAQVETQQIEIESLKKELETKAYQLYQEQLEKQQVLKANEKFQALSDEFNKLSSQKDTLFTILELMLKK